MPTSAIDAMKMSDTLELSDSEKKWFDNLCKYTDILISKFFNGEYVEIGFENMFIDNTNYGHHPYSILCWRQVAVVNVWIKTYEDVGWKVIPSGKKWECNKKHYRFSSYTLEPDLRDIKIKEILK